MGRWRSRSRHGVRFAVFDFERHVVVGCRRILDGGDPLIYSRDRASVDRNYDRYTGIPRMSGIPVSVERFQSGVPMT